MSEVRLSIDAKQGPRSLRDVIGRLARWNAMWAAGQVKRKSGFNAIYFPLSLSLLHLRRTARLGLGAGISCVAMQTETPSSWTIVDISLAHTPRASRFPRYSHFSRGQIGENGRMDRHWDSCPAVTQLG